MKKGLGILCVLFLFISGIKADIKKEENVELSRCIDGDTAAFVSKGKEVKVRFLAINAPEYTKEKEKFGKEASAYVCDQLTNANTITIQYDENAKQDKYGRELAWIFVDGSLLQEELVKKGLAEVKYVYDDYTYTKTLQEAEKVAKEKLNMWSEYDDSLLSVYDWKTIIPSVLIIILAFLFVKNKNEKRRIIKKQVKKIQKSIK